MLTGNWHVVCLHLFEFILHHLMTDIEYNECVNLHADALYRFILKNIRNKHDAEDIVQSTFEKMWTKRHAVNPLNGRAYLFKVAYHEMIDHFRRRKPGGEMQDVPVYYSGQDAKKILAVALSRLPTIQRALIALKDVEGYSYEEIGSITGLNPMQVKVYLHRARLRVKNYLGALENVLDAV